jgi:LemA protein
MDKIGMLLDATTGSQIQEQEVFKAIAEGRKTYQAANTSEEKIAASQQISTVVAQLPRLQEAYPELKSNGNVQSLMGEMANIEVKIADSRKQYNETATNYNTTVQSIPKNIFAGLGGFKTKPLYKADAAAKKAPDTDTTKTLRGN